MTVGQRPRAFGRDGRQGTRRIVLALALVALAAAQGRARASDEPPAAVPPGARFETRRLDFPTRRLGFETRRVVWETGRLLWPQQRLAEPKKASREELHFALAGDVLFDFDRAELRPAAEAVLADLLAQVRAKLPRARFEVEGHTDALGTEAYNRTLSERRAEAVRGWLVRRGGVPAAAVRARGFGESRPAAPETRPDGSDDPVGRQKNRRVEIIVRSGR